jgi:predicted phosphodiesterase
LTLKGDVMQVLKQFDLISDIHLDFYVDYYAQRFSLEKQIDAFVEQILPETSISKVLLIGGDIGHNNMQNYDLLKSLKRYYEKILIVFGNHDLYLISPESLSYYDYSSLNRWQEMQDLALSLDGVSILSGNQIIIDGTSFTGTGMWYDCKYGETLGYAEDEIKRNWERNINDARRIYGLPNFNEELEKLEAHFDTSDVILTHVGPDWDHMPLYYKYDINSSFFYFDGIHLLERAKGKIWCYGHTHSTADYKKLDCRLLNNSFGYPNESRGRRIIGVNLLE